MDAQTQHNLLIAAYALLTEFSETIHEKMEGDHPAPDSVDRWLHAYERGSGIAFPTVPQATVTNLMM